MMKKITFLFAVILLVAACNSEPRYVISGNIADGDSVTVVLQKRVGSETVVIDSAMILNGKFSIKGGAVDYPEQVTLLARGKRGTKTFYLENSDITITAHVDTLGKAVVSGSVTEDEVKALAAQILVINESNSALNAEYRAAREANDTAMMSDLRNQMMANSDKVDAINMEFLTTQTSSFHAPVVLRGMAYDMSAEEIEGYLAAFTPEVAASKTATDLAERAAIMKTVAIGAKAPDFTLNDPDGNPVSLYSKVGTKLLLVDFWAAWCGPCRGENPNVVAVYNDYHALGFDVFGVSLDRAKEDWVKAIADDKLTWTHVSDLQYWSSAAAKQYAVNSIPASFLLDENGVIIARNLRGDDLRNKVKELLGQ